MRTTIRIDDDLLHELKAKATQEKSSLNSLINRTLRRGLMETNKPSTKGRSRYREKTFAMGQPAFNLDKALRLAEMLEDEATVAKLAARE